MPVYAYSVIAGVEKDEDEDSPTYGQDVRVDYQPGTDITSKFPKEVLKKFLSTGTASLYDRTKTPEEAAELADEENALLRTQVEEFKLRLQGAEEEAAKGQANELAAKQIQEENEKLREEVTKLRKQLQEKQASDAQKVGEQKPQTS
jgi:hypothetical protein